MTLIPAQSRTVPDPARESLDLAAAKASLLRASFKRQQPLIAQVDDMLPRRPQDRRGLTCSDQPTLVHVLMMPLKHKKHKASTTPRRLSVRREKRVLE